jgi:hypothetical protein
MPRGVGTGAVVTRAATERRPAMDAREAIKVLIEFRRA